MNNNAHPSFLSNILYKYTINIIQCLADEYNFNPNKNIELLT